MTFPVLMVHGMCCTGEVWHNFRRFFEERGADVTTPTLRSDVRVRRNVPKRLRHVRLSDYVEQLEGEIDAIEARTGETPALIGHSMGGLLAQLLAERNRVRAAVFISPTAPVGARDPQDRLMWGALRAFGKLGLTPGIIQPGRGFTSRAVLNATNTEQRRRAQASFVAESGRAFLDFATATVDEHKIRIPVLTVAATRDRLVPARTSRLTAKKYAPVGGELLEYAEHGHWLYDEPGWEKPAADIYAWFESKLAAAGAGVSGVPPSGLARDDSQLAS